LIASGAGTETLAVDDTDLWRQMRLINALCRFAEMAD
jgi:hypothetical protein